MAASRPVGLKRHEPGLLNALDIMTEVSVAPAVVTASNTKDCLDRPRFSFAKELTKKHQPKQIELPRTKIAVVPTPGSSHRWAAYLSEGHSSK